MSPIAPATRADDVIETVHGEHVADPYRWLEEAESTETRSWVDAQNEHSRTVLDAMPGRREIEARLTELLAVGTIGAPVERGGRLFYVRRSGRQNQPVLLVREGETNRVLLDPNQASEEGTVALDWWYPSPDGRLVAYGYSANGDEWSVLRIREVETGEDLPDLIPRTRACSLAWLPDTSGFFYTRYPAPGTVPPGDAQYGRQAYLHLLGADSARDDRIFHQEIPREAWVSVDLSDDGRLLAVVVSHGWNRSDVWLCDRAEPDSEFQAVVVGEDAIFIPIFAGNALLLLTNLAAPRYRLVRVDLARPADRTAWQVIIPEDPEAVLEAVTPVGRNLVARYGHDASSRLAVFAADGGSRHDVELPGLGTVTAVEGEWEQEAAYLAFESFALPPAVYRLDPATAALDRWAAVEAPIDPDAYAVRQEWYTSRDGSRIPLFLIHRRDLDPDRPHPAVLTGYGGFNVALTPSFDRSLPLWLDAGGIYAVATLRGGSEYGEDWHRAGMLDRKQNVFDDFIAGAEHLIDAGYTTSDRLAISGRSNGGLLVGAALTQRPDLFRAVVCGVPLLDMVRYHLFLIARLWTPEYGSPEDPEEFRALYAYSPYHHVQDGTAYPAVLLVTAEADSRVDPMHARKMAARLQAATSSGKPILLKVEERAGHGVGKPLAKIVADRTDTWAFIMEELGVTVPWMSMPQH